MSKATTRTQPNGPLWIRRTTAVDLKQDVLQRIEAYFEYETHVKEHSSDNLHSLWVNGEIHKMVATKVCKYAIDDLGLKSVKWVEGNQLSKRTMVLSPFDPSMESPDDDYTDKSSEEFTNIELSSDDTTGDKSADLTPASVEGNVTSPEQTMGISSDDDALRDVIVSVVDTYFVQQRKQNREDLQTDIRTIMTEVMGSMIKGDINDTMETIIESNTPRVIENLTSSMQNIESKATATWEGIAQSQSEVVIEKIEHKGQNIIKTFAIKRDEVLEAINEEADQAIEDFRSVTEKTLKKHEQNNKDVPMEEKPKVHPSFKNVNLNLKSPTMEEFQRPNHNHSEYMIQGHARDPTRSTLSAYGFHKYFKAKLKNDNYILNFYQQLCKQGAAYGIHCIPMHEIHPNIDLCPKQYEYRRNEMSLTIYQKLQDEDCVSVGYSKAQKVVHQYAGISDGYRVLEQLLRFVHPNLRQSTANTYNVPNLSSSYGNLYDYGSKIMNYILMQNIQHRSYTETEKTVMFLNNMDDSKYNEAKNRALTEVRHISNSNKEGTLNSNLMLESLPTTIEQYHEQLHGPTVTENKRYVRSMQAGTMAHEEYDGLDEDKPVVRAFMRRREYQQRRSPRSNNYNEYRGKDYMENRKDFSQNPKKQCKACGRWGCAERRCQFVAKVQLAINYIKDNSNAATKLAQEYLRTNNSKTRMSLIRTIHAGLDSETNSTHTSDVDLFDQYHLEIPMEEIEFDSNDDE